MSFRTTSSIFCFDFSSNEKNWHLPGGCLDEIILCKDLAKKEVYEETGLEVEILSLACFDEVTVKEDKVWNEDFKKELDFPHLNKSVGLYYHCKITGSEKLKEDWVDLCGGYIKYQKFMLEEEAKPYIKKSFGNSSFEEIKKLQSIDLQLK